MRILEFRNWRRPSLAAIGWGINVCTLLNLVAMLASGDFADLPRAVRAGPAVGFALAVVFYLLAMRRQPKTREASQ